MGNICNSLCPPSAVEPLEAIDINKVPARPPATITDARESLSQINIMAPSIEVTSVDRDTIKPAPIDEETKGIFDYTAYVDIE